MHFELRFQEAEKVLMTEFTQTLFSVADDVYMDVKFNPALINSFRLLGFEIFLFKRDYTLSDLKQNVFVVNFIYIIPRLFLNQKIFLLAYQ